MLFPAFNFALGGAFFFFCPARAGRRWRASPGRSARKRKAELLRRMQQETRRKKARAQLIEQQPAAGRAYRQRNG